MATTHIRTCLFEKPSQAADWARFLGFKGQDKKRGFYFNKEQGIYLVSAVGHLFELAGPEHYVPELKKSWQFKHLPVYPKTFHVSLSEDKKGIFKTIKSILAKTDELFLCTDPDNEGELIARDIVKHAGYKGVMKRVLFSATDDGSLRKAWANPVDESVTNYMAKEADLRRRLDWLVGMNLTMGMTTRLRQKGELKKGAFPVGRVITAASLIVLTNTLARRNFKPTSYFGVKLKCKKASGDEFYCTLNMPEQYLDPNSGRLLSRKVAESFAAAAVGSKMSVSSVDEKRKNVSPPLPFDLSSLQIAMDKFDIGAKETLSLLQTLYDPPLSAVTYPRTDKRHLPESMLGDAKKIVNHLNNTIPHIKSLELDLGKRPKCFNDKKVNVHHGIIPSLKSANLRKLTDKQICVYLAVALRYVAQFMGDYCFDSKAVTLRLSDAITAHCKATKVVSFGWKEAEKMITGKEGQEEEEEQYLDIEEGESVVIVDAEVIEGKTKKPDLMSEAKLVAAMEKPGIYVSDEKIKKMLIESDGIGTAATRSDTIDRAIKKSLIRKVGKGLEATKMFEMNANYFKNMDAGFTALLQRAVKSATNGDSAEESVLEQHQRFITKTLEGWN